MVAEGKKKKRGDLFLSVVFNYIETMFYYNYNGLKLMVYSERMQADKAVSSFVFTIIRWDFFIIFQNPLP